MKPNPNSPQPPQPLVRLSNAAAWKFSVRIFQSLLWHANSEGKLVVHKAPPVIAAAVVGVFSVLNGPEAGAALSAGAAGAFTVLALPAVRLEFRKSNNPYTNAEQSAVLVVKALKDGSWKPDLHVKLKGMSQKDTAAFRVDTMVRVLQAANDHGVALTTTPRDARLYGRYLRDLIAAQNTLGIPREQRRRIEVTGRAFPRGFHCVAPPTPPGPGPDTPSGPSTGPAHGGQGRVPGGIPSGGQYASHIHAEPGIQLRGGTDDRTPDRDVE